MRQPVVAVFGRNDATPEELDTARRFGAAIARAGAILLTGGVGNGAPQIKEQAIVGAGSHPWIGVANSARLTPPRRVGGGVVLSPGVGHRRNFLGATLCDAAIALCGGDGTASEIVFALALRRPLVVYGWTPDHDVVTAAQRTVPRTDGPAPLDRAIAAAYDRAVLVPEPVPPGTPPEHVVADLLSVATDPVSTDTLHGLRDQAAWDALVSDRPLP